MGMNSPCDEIREKIELLASPDIILQHAYLLKESPSKEYYNRAIEFLKAYTRAMDEIETMLKEEDCGDLEKEYEEMKPELLDKLSELQEAIDNHEKIIKNMEDTYALGLAKIVNAILTGKMEKKEPKSFIEKIKIMLAPKPREVDKISRKIADEIYKSNRKRLEQLTKEIDYDDPDAKLREYKEKIEKLAYDNLEVDRDFLLKNYNSMIMKSFVENPREVENTRTSLAGVRIKIETLGGNPEEVEKALPIPRIGEFIKGEISFEEVAKDYYIDYVDKIVEKVNELNKKNYEKFKKDKEDVIKTIDSVLNSISF